MPVWLPLPEYAGLMAHDVTASYDAGLVTRPLAETARDTLRWLDAEPGRPGHRLVARGRGDGARRLARARLSRPLVDERSDHNPHPRAGRDRWPVPAHSHEAEPAATATSDVRGGARGPLASGR